MFSELSILCLIRDDLQRFLRYRDTDCKQFRYSLIGLISLVPKRIEAISEYEAFELIEDLAKNTFNECTAQTLIHRINHVLD